APGARQGRHGSPASRRRPHQRRTAASRRGGGTLAVGGRRDGGSGWCTVSPPAPPGSGPRARPTSRAPRRRGAPKKTTLPAKRSKRPDAPPFRGPKKAKRHRKDGQSAKDEPDSALDGLDALQKVSSAETVIECSRPLLSRCPDHAFRSPGTVSS
ncbi:hypothetical protein THAOC_05692, partial [Thalassiosira oceanica]